VTGRQLDGAPLVSRYQSSSFQATLAQNLTLSGRDGFSGEHAEVMLAPAEPNSGITFTCRDVSFSLGALEPRYTSRRTTTLVASNGWQVTTTEHLLSAIYGLGVTNVHVTVGDNGSIPFFDGSSHEFCAAILRVGIKPQDQFRRRHLYCQRVARLDGDDTSYIEVHPPTTKSLRIAVTIEFQPPIGIQTFEYLHSVSGYCLHLAWARTFATKDFDSLEQVQRRLPAFEWRESHAGGYVDAPMLVFEGGRFLLPLRRDDEPVRHKLVDFIGDIALAGGELHADVTLHRPGHKLNADLVRLLRSASEGDGTPARLQPRHTGDDSQFVRDVTIPAGSVFRRKEWFVKTWEIRNAGSIPWRGRQLARLGPSKGSGNLESAAFVGVPDTEPGATALISIDVRAPDEPGAFRAEWKMVDEKGEYLFPNRYGLTLEIIVE